MVRRVLLPIPERARIVRLARKMADVLPAGLRRVGGDGRDPLSADVPIQLTPLVLQSRGSRKNFMKIKLLFATLLPLSLSTAGHAQTLDKAKLDQFFDRLAEKNKAMGNLTIAKDGNVLYTRAIGYSQINGTEKKPLTAASTFRLVSITKMFTATMILQLVEEGKLKLTDTLDKFIPQVPNAQKITIAQILGHRSG